MPKRKTVTGSARPASPGRAYSPDLHDCFEHGVIAIPEAVPELGVEAGDEGTIAGAHEGGRLLDVEISRHDGTSAGSVDIRVGGDGATRVFGYSLL